MKNICFIIIFACFSIPLDACDTGKVRDLMDKFKKNHRGGAHFKVSEYPVGQLIEALKICGAAWEKGQYSQEYCSTGYFVVGKEYYPRVHCYDGDYSDLIDSSDKTLMKSLGSADYIFEPDAIERFLQEIDESKGSGEMFKRTFK